MKRILLTALLTAAALPAAANDLVCAERDVERLDYYTNPPTRGDNGFFSFTVSGTANVTMLYPGTASMRAFPISLYELKQPAVAGPPNGAINAGNGKGCQNAYLNSLNYFMPTNVDAPAAPATLATDYQPATVYPEPEVRYSGGGGLAFNFEKTTFTPTNTDATGGNAWQYLKWPANDAPATQSIDQACTASTAQAADLNDCKKCVRERGYWINYNIVNDADTSPNVMVVKGNWLNFFPPKWALLRLAYKRLVNGSLLNPLREGIVTNNGATGMYRQQKMLPQSCQGAGRPNQRIASTDSVTYTSTANPLAEMLFNVAWTVSSDSNGSPPATWDQFTSQATHPASEPGVSGETGKKAGFCPGCNAGFSVIFSDGRGIDGLANCSNVNPLAVLPGYCNGRNTFSSCAGPTTAGLPGLGLGNEKDGDDFLNPNTAGGAAAKISGATATYATQGAGTCPNDWLDDVAAWMYGTNLYSPQPGTNLRLYAIEIGTNYMGELSILDSAARAGKGLAIRASNFAALEDAVKRVFLDIISNATSFSVAAITTVQTRGTTFAFIPRFRPQVGPQWEGRLYRFRLYNEFAAGCGPFETSGDGGAPVKDALNPNGNASCTDLYLQDADGGFVAEDDGGAFVLLDTNATYDGGWPLKSPKTAAVPVWEASDVLTAREILSVADAGTPRNILALYVDAGIPAPGASGTSLIPFNQPNDSNTVAMMSNYMKLGGVNSEFCVGMSQSTRTAYATKDDCGKDLIKFLEGQDIMRQGTDGGAARPYILGDIFHSSPILVTPPVPTDLCGKGINNQCIKTLYADDFRFGYTSGGKAAYDAYLNKFYGRPEVILVGANDGMLHAFNAGTYHAPDAGAADAGSYDEGTGEELWAFIPPDMMPKLQRYALAENHQILVDGSPWVRDIWKDATTNDPSVVSATAADNTKQAHEFHTIAVVGERQGGRHYTALDITRTDLPPKFLWTWPPPGTSLELTAGESWNDTTPTAPPIGPILVADTNGPIRFQWNGVTTRASERWVVALSGGYDPNLVRGRALYIVDAWTGELLYKFSRYDTSSNSDPRYTLGSVAAPMGLIDVNADGFFDAAYAGDADGNLWTLDMLAPASFSSGLVTNWFTGLTFRQFKAGTVAQRAPFFDIVNAALLTRSNPDQNEVRVYLGSGDRDQIKVRDTDAVDGGTCALDNIRGCLRNNCAVDVEQSTYSIAPTSGSTGESMTGRWAVATGGAGYSTNTFTVSGPDGGAVACSDWATADIRYRITCAGTNMVDPVDAGFPIDNMLTCDFDGGADAGEECLVTTGRPTVGVAFTSPSITKTRFYSIKPYDPPSFTAHPRMVSDATATTYNTAANVLTETNLTDVTDGGTMAASASGWMVTHTNDTNEKTASAPLLLGGCVAWNTLVPSVLGQSDAGTCNSNGAIPPDSAYLYQADYLSGGVGCGLPGSATATATARSTRRDVTVTPQQLTPVVSLNQRTGEAAYSGVSLEPGGRVPIQLAVGSQAVQGDVSWLDVPRDLDRCRHLRLPDGGTGTPVCQ